MMGAKGKEKASDARVMQQRSAVFHLLMPEDFASIELGHEIAVIGNTPELGMWDPKKSPVRLHRLPSDAMHFMSDRVAVTSVDISQSDMDALSMSQPAVAEGKLRPAVAYSDDTGINLHRERLKLRLLTIQREILAQDVHTPPPVSSNTVTIPPSKDGVIQRRSYALQNRKRLEERESVVREELAQYELRQRAVQRQAGPPGIPLGLQEAIRSAGNGRDADAVTYTYVVIKPSLGQPGPLGLKRKADEQTPSKTYLYENVSEESDIGARRLSQNIHQYDFQFENQDYYAYGRDKTRNYVRYLLDMVPRSEEHITEIVYGLEHVLQERALLDSTTVREMLMLIHDTAGTDPRLKFINLMLIALVNESHPALLAKYDHGARLLVTDEEYMQLAHVYTRQFPKRYHQLYASILPLLL